MSRSHIFQGHTNVKVTHKCLVLHFCIEDNNHVLYVWTLIAYKHQTIQQKQQTFKKNTSILATRNRNKILLHISKQSQNILNLNSNILYKQ